MINHIYTAARLVSSMPTLHGGGRPWHQPQEETRAPREGLGHLPIEADIFEIIHDLHAAYEVFERMLRAKTKEAFFRELNKLWCLWGIGRQGVQAETGRINPLKRLSELFDALSQYDPARYTELQGFVSYLELELEPLINRAIVRKARSLKLDIRKLAPDLRLIKKDLVSKRLMQRRDPYAYGRMQWASWNFGPGLEDTLPLRALQAACQAYTYSWGQKPGARHLRMLLEGLILLSGHLKHKAQMAYVRRAQNLPGYVWIFFSRERFALWGRSGVSPEKLKSTLRLLTGLKDPETGHPLFIIKTDRLGRGSILYIQGRMARWLMQPACGLAGIKKDLARHIGTGEAALFCAILASTQPYYDWRTFVALIYKLRDTIGRSNLRRALEHVLHVDMRALKRTLKYYVRRAPAMIFRTDDYFNRHRALVERLRRTYYARAWALGLLRTLERLRGAALRAIAGKRPARTPIDIQFGKHVERKVRAISTLVLTQPSLYDKKIFHDITYKTKQKFSLSSFLQNLAFHRICYLSSFLSSRLEKAGTVTGNPGTVLVTLGFCHLEIVKQALGFWDSKIEQWIMC